MFNSNQMFIFCNKYILLLGERKSIQGYGADMSYGSRLEQITKSCTSLLKHWGVYDLRPQQLKKTKIKGLKIYILRVVNCKNAVDPTQLDSIWAQKV